MEQKQSKQRNMKSSTAKSEPVTEKMVLKAESVVEVKSKTTKGSKATPVVAAPLPTPAPETSVPVRASKAKKTETPVQQVQTPTPVKSTKSAKAVPTPTAPVPPTAPVQTAGQAKGKRVAQNAGATATTTPAPVQATTTTTKTPRATKKAASETTTTPVQKAGAKATKKATTEPVVKATKKVQKVKAEETQEEKQMDDKLRYFKLYYNDNICGRYSGKKPKQAANKAFSSIIKDMKKTDNKEGVNIDITFTIKECTRNSFHKEYKYVGKRLLLKSPVKVTIENGDGTSKDIVYKYHNELKKAPRV